MFDRKVHKRIRLNTYIYRESLGIFQIPKDFIRRKGYAFIHAVRAAVSASVRRHLPHTCFDQQAQTAY